MKRRLLLVAIFLAASAMLALWLNATWYVYAMAAFGCADLAGKTQTCVRTIQSSAEIKALGGLIVWIIGSGLLIRKWDRR